MSNIVNVGVDMRPKLVRNIFGLPTENRETIKIPALDSAVLFLGSFVSLREFGVRAFNDDDIIYGFVKNITRKGQLLPIWNDSKMAGAVTAASGYVPAYYTFSATNDESNTTSAKLEMVEIVPVFFGDILSMVLWGASTSPVARATTTAWGTTASSRNIGAYMSVDTTYTFALTESTASATETNLDFRTVSIDGQLPESKYRVYAQCVRSANSYLVAAA
jgi:hypothetical protein